VAGRLAPGREADVLVVRGDPTRDLAALHQVLDIYQGGRRVEREEHQVPISKSTE
jgi:imidazolonepropionase-like amidohydrolase